MFLGKDEETTTLFLTCRFRKIANPGQNEKNYVAEVFLRISVNKYTPTHHSSLFPA